MFFTQDTEFDSIDDLIAEFTHLEQHVDQAPFTEPLETVFPILEDGHQGYFDAQADPEGIPWPKLKPVTIALKGHATILIDTYDLVRSLTSSDATGAIRHVNQNELIFGTSIDYSATHQDGKPEKNIPPRPHVGWSDTLVDDVANHLVDELVESLF